MNQSLKTELPIQLIANDKFNNLTGTPGEIKPGLLTIAPEDIESCYSSLNENECTIITKSGYDFVITLPYSRVKEIING